MAATQHTVPPWTGKALGAALGMALAPGGPSAYTAWLLGGLSLGHGFDGAGLQLDGSASPRHCHKPMAARRTSLRFTFAGLGRIAAASGQVRLDHVECAERLMARLAFTPERRIEARGWFQEGRNPAFPFATVAPAGRSELEAHPVLRDLAARSLCRMTILADAPVSLVTLFSLAEQVGLDRSDLARQLAALAEPPAERTPAERARDTLGVGGDDSPETIRFAHRRLVERWHPERFRSIAGDEVRAIAEARVRQLDDALAVLTWIGDGRR